MSMGGAISGVGRRVRENLNNNCSNLSLPFKSFFAYLYVILISPLYVVCLIIYSS